MRWFETPQPLPLVGTEAEEWYHPHSYVVSRCASWYFLKKTTSKKTKYLTHQNVAGHLNNKKSRNNQNVHQRNWSVDWKYQPTEDGVDTENYHDEDNVYVWYDIRGGETTILNGYVLMNLPHCQRTCVVQFSSVAQSCPTLRDPMDCSTPGEPGMLGP